jgi:hypothetical protein
MLPVKQEMFNYNAVPDFDVTRHFFGLNNKEPVLTCKEKASVQPSVYVWPPPEVWLSVCPKAV